MKLNKLQQIYARRPTQPWQPHYLPQQHQQQQFHHPPPPAAPDYRNSPHFFAPPASASSLHAHPQSMPQARSIPFISTTGPNRPFGSVGAPPNGYHPQAPPSADSGAFMPATSSAHDALAATSAYKGNYSLQPQDNSHLIAHMAPSGATSTASSRPPSPSAATYRPPEIPQYSITSTPFSKADAKDKVDSSSQGDASVPLKEHQQQSAKLSHAVEASFNQNLLTPMAVSAGGGKS